MKNGRPGMRILVGGWICYGLALLLPIGVGLISVISGVPPSVAPAVLLSLCGALCLLLSAFIWCVSETIVVL